MNGTTEAEMAETLSWLRKPGVTSVRKIAGQIGEKTAGLIAERIGAKIDSSIEDKIAVKIVNLTDEKIGGRIASLTGERIVGLTQAGNCVGSIVSIKSRENMAVTGERMPA